MFTSRTRSFSAGLALIGLGGTLIVQSFAPDDDAAPDDAPLGERNAQATVPYKSGENIAKAFTIERDAAELYAYWRDFSNLPQIMTHLQRVDVDGDVSHWVTRGPAGSSIAWDAQIIEDRPNDFISWRSLDGSSVKHAGSVRFRPAPGDRGTEVRVELAWVSPGGKLGSLFAAAFGESPAKQIEDDLRRFKSLMEAGDVALNGTDVKA